MIGRVGVLLVALSVCAQAQAQTKLAVGYGFSSDFLPGLVAQDEGVYAKHGLDVTFSVVQNTSMAPAILTSGTVQIVVQTPTNLVLADAGGLDQVVVAGAARVTKENQQVGLLTRPGFTVTKAADLKGKTLGTPGINSVIDLLLKKWLLDRHVLLNEVTFREVAAPQMGDVLKSGQVDAIAVFQPLLSRFVAAGDGTLSVDFVSEVRPNILGAFWTATRDWADGNRPTVAAFRASLADAEVLIAKDPEMARAVEQKYLHFAEQRFPTFDVNVTPSDMEFFVAMCRQLGLIPKSLDTSKLIFK